MKNFLYRLVFTKGDALDLSWVLLVLIVLAGIIVFFLEPLYGIRASVAGWSFIGGAFASVLLAAVPISKARLIAASKIHTETLNNIKDSDKSTDIKEIIG